MTQRKMKVKKIIRGPTKGDDGQLIAEDGKKVTPAIESIYKFKEDIQNTRSVKKYTERNPRDIRKIEGNAINAEILKVPKVCENCYLQDKCPHFDENATCYFRTSVRLQSPEDMIELTRMLLEIQGERVLFGRFIEQAEGGYVDRNLSDEFKRMFTMLKDFKELLSENEEILVKVKGKRAVESAGGGILSEIFGRKETEDKRTD